MTGRILEAGHTAAPDHMPKRAQDFACIQGGVHTRNYGSKGEMLSETNARGWVTRFEYDATQQFVTKITSPLGYVNSTAWDLSCQQPERTTDANAQSTVFTYDVFCRESSMKAPGVSTAILHTLLTGIPKSRI
ncbi:MAG: hypothetical protein ACRCTO_21100 [Pseudomonas paracarnis]